MRSCTNTRENGLRVNHQIARRTDISIDAMDLVPTRHNLIQGILKLLSMSINNSDSIQNTETIKNTIWAAQDLHALAKDALDLLFASSKSDSGRLKERKRK